MRYDETNTQIPTALEFINNSAMYDLISIFRKFGEERYSEALAKKIIES